MTRGMLLGPLAVALLAAPAQGREQDTRGDFNVFAKGGVSAFTGELDEFAAAGPAWGLTVNLQPWNVLGFELGYDGSRHTLEGAALGLTSPAMTRHGGTALLKLGLPFIEKVKPFVGAGLGATYVLVSGDPVGRYRNDLMEEVPVTGGIEFNSGAFTAGVRGGYRFLIDEGFADPAGVGNPQGGMFDVLASIGGRF